MTEELTGWQLAQVNIARMREPLDSPLMADFVAGLDPVNAAAESADGFVWRLTGEGNDATSLRFMDDPWLIVNMSVWRDGEALFEFVYSEEHRPFLKRRREWFARMQEAVTVLWWVPAGHEPTVAEAEARLRALREDGPTPYAFTLADRFPLPVPATESAAEDE
ncbi:DUF3291 domain-containing protein [Streptacidiphilus jiangxiensis]|uniref:DUF3291 domain-containing protein n=1 Tax=Streptacidiphilus jiangxiensis TaxID=235985 RepID=A0A1H7WS45_STRJI|nr:DUF3291 domain-containing protein [Streptacidiphilus jiangxiensis]SEM24362.1 protein of unknown function [Streptacidiphilus jiangxiensis]